MRPCPTGNDAPEKLFFEIFFEKLHKTYRGECIHGKLTVNSYERRKRNSALIGYCIEACEKGGFCEFKRHASGNVESLFIANQDAKLTAFNAYF